MDPAVLPVNLQGVPISSDDSQLRVPINKRGLPAINMCGRINTKHIPSHAFWTSSCIIYSSAFLTIGIVIVTRMPRIICTHCYDNNGVG
jgi:hypothetical protein